jgi:hypothetical protein
MEEEANDDGVSEVEDSLPSKRRRIEAIGLDDEEAEIASGLRRVHDTDGALQLEQDKTGRQDGGSGDGEEDDEGSGKVGGTGAVDDYSGDTNTGFEDNGVCP